MTAPTSVEIPAPLDWQHFERLTRAVFSEAFSADFARYGRSGQRQNGVDILGRLRTGQIVAVQCKGRSSSLGRNLTEQDIQDAVGEADSFPGDIDLFYIVTTAPEDATLQRYVLDLSKNRADKGRFQVMLWGWQAMSDQIRSSPKVMKTFYGHWWHKPSLKYIGAAVLLATVIGSVGVVASSRAEQWFALRDASRTSTVAGLQQVVATLDELDSSYKKCLISMAGKAFVFSDDLKRNCSTPISLPLDRLRKEHDQMAGLMDADALAEVETAREYLEDDYSGLSEAIDMSKGLEQQAVEVSKTLCPRQPSPKSEQRDSETSLRKTGEDALSEQMAQYYRMRDFAVPAIDSLKARMALASRRQRGQETPKDLVERASVLPELLKEERSFAYKLPETPFATARVKEMSSRTLTVSSPPTDPVDDMVWMQTAQEALFEGLKRDKRDVEYLISCGFLKPAARVLEQSKVTNDS